MVERKAIPKKVRFEVFKRDKFTCQYCGRMAPDVVLEIDHIKPVAEGGENDMLNLITSCSDCNRGKGKVRLSDDAEIKKQQTALRELAAKREQIEMMYEWKKELASQKKRTIEYISDLIEIASGYGLNEHGKSEVARLLQQFPVPLIMEAVDISYTQYYDGSDETFEKAFSKIGGICYNMQKDKEDGKGLHNDQ